MNCCPKFSKNMRSQENVTFSILPHGDGSVESSKLLAMGHISDFVGGRWKTFLSLSSLVVVISFVTLKFQIYIFSGYPKNIYIYLVVEFMGLKPKLNFFTFYFLVVKKSWNQSWKTPVISSVQMQYTMLTIYLSLKDNSFILTNQTA